MLGQQASPAHHSRMKFALWMTASCGLAVALSGCGNQAGGDSGYQQAATGPFDSRGNYVEEWADNPSQWKKGSGGRSSGSTRPSEPVAPVDDVPEIAQNEEPPMNSVPLPSPAVTSNPKPKISEPKSTPKESVKSTATVEAKPKPKPKSTEVVKKKTPPKATAKRYTIKKGDSLSAIASRNGTTVGALQRANGIKGSLIQPGKTLVIPK